jgi:plastocyanin
MTKRLAFIVAFMLSAAAAVGGPVNAQQETAPLNASISGDGAISLSTGDSLGCSGTCHATFRPSRRPVVVKALPSTGWQFVKWTGGCLGVRPTCVVHLGHGVHVNAAFSRRPPARAATTVNVVAGMPTEFGFALSKTTVSRGTVTFHVSNGGIVPHDFRICSAPSDGSANTCDGTGTPIGGGTFTVTLTAPGTYEYLCTLSGHAAAGMKGLLTVR